jgi:hypothetical protein
MLPAAAIRKTTSMLNIPPFAGQKEREYIAGLVAEAMENHSGRLASMVGSAVSTHLGNQTRIMENMSNRLMGMEQEMASLREDMASLVSSSHHSSPRAGSGGLDHTQFHMVQRPGPMARGGATHSSSSSPQATPPPSIYTHGAAGGAPEDEELALILEISRREALLRDQQLEEEERELERQIAAVEESQLTVNRRLAAAQRQEELARLQERQRRDEEQELSRQIGMEETMRMRRREQESVAARRREEASHQFRVASPQGAAGGLPDLGQGLYRGIVPLLQPRTVSREETELLISIEAAERENMEAEDRDRALAGGRALPLLVGGQGPAGGASHTGIQQEPQPS